MGFCAKKATPYVAAPGGTPLRPRRQTQGVRRVRVADEPVRVGGVTERRPHEEDQMAVTTEGATDAAVIRPFTSEVPEADLQDLRARVAATRFPETETVEDDS